MGKSKLQLLADQFPKLKRFLVFQRFLDYVEFGEDDECWNWKGATIGSYGQFWWPEKHIRCAHQAAFELFIGKRRGLCVCHSCDNGLCVNPNHLWLGTYKQNTQDMIAKGRRAPTTGEGAGGHKLTWEQVGAIRGLWVTGKYTTKLLARMYGVTQSNVSRLVRNETWVTGVTQ